MTNPLDGDEHISGNKVLEVDLPDDLDLADHQLIEDGKPCPRWCASQPLKWVLLPTADQGELASAFSESAPEASSPAEERMPGKRVFPAAERLIALSTDEVGPDIDVMDEPELASSPRRLAFAGSGSKLSNPWKPPESPAWDGWKTR